MTINVECITKTLSWIVPTVDATSSIINNTGFISSTCIHIRSMCNTSIRKVHPYQQCVYRSTFLLFVEPVIPPDTPGMKSHGEKHNSTKEKERLVVWIVILLFSFLRSVSIAISQLTTGSGQSCYSEAKLPEAQSCSIFPLWLAVFHMPIRLL